MSKPAAYGFFASLTNSVYSPSFYAALPQKTFWSSIWYLTRVTLLIFLIGTLIALTLLIKNWDSIDQTVVNALNVYPEDLVLTFQDGQMTSNQAEPYFIESQEVLPEQLRDDLLGSGEFPKNIVVIDTVTPFSVEQFEAYDVVIWMAKDTAYIDDDNGGIEANSLSTVPNTIVDKAFVDGKVGTFWDQVKTALPFLAVIGFVVAVLVMVIFRMVYSVVLAVGVLIIGSIMKLALDFEASYKVALHAITLPSFLSMAILLTSRSTGFTGFPFWFTLLSLLIIAVNLQKAKSLKLLK